MVGSYPRSSADLEKLISHKVTAIFSIQSERDYKKHGLTPHFLNLLCQESGLRYQRYSILDMNNDDFINKAEGGLKILRDMIKSGERVYVHCTAGIYRSPQMIALYLTIFDKYSLEEAVHFIKRNHPYAKPNCKVIKNTIGMMDLRRSAKQIYLWLYTTYSS